MPNTILDLDSLLDSVDNNNSSERPSRRRFPPQVAKARNAERTNRSNEASRLALAAFRAAHPGEYERLLEQARRRVDDRRGPLPGDDLSDPSASVN